MLIFRGGSWPGHRRWFVATLAATAAAVLWYGVESSRADAWIGGGSVPGLTFGVLGGLIVVFEMLLWVRKKFRAARIGRARLWMKAHIWLGFLCLPLIVMHSGFRWWGGSLAAVLMLSFLAVILSGIWGLILQQILPRSLLEHVPAETIRSEIDVVLGHLIEEAGRFVGVVCGSDETAALLAESGVGGTPEKTFLVVGAVRGDGPVQGRVVLTRGQVRRVPGSEPLLTFFEDVVAPYLRAKKNASRSSLASAQRSGALFRSLRSRLDPATHGVVDLLEDACNQRRQFDLQARLHFWLHGWLCVHLPVSVAMFVLMLAHIYYALRYY